MGPYLANIAQFSEMQKHIFGTMVGAAKNILGTKTNFFLGNIIDFLIFHIFRACQRKRISLDEDWDPFEFNDDLFASDFDLGSSFLFGLLSNSSENDDDGDLFSENNENQNSKGRLIRRKKYILGFKFFDLQN